MYLIIETNLDKGISRIYIRKNLSEADFKELSDVTPFKTSDKIINLENCSLYNPSTGGFELIDEELDYEPEYCESCEAEFEESGIEYTHEYHIENGTAICEHCGQSL